MSKVKKILGVAGLTSLIRKVGGVQKKSLSRFAQNVLFVFLLMPASSQRQKQKARHCVQGFSFVGVAGFEPTTSSSRTKRATGLRYTPGL